MNSNINNFWQDLPNNFLVLAPMEDVTDIVFRQIVRTANEGKPQVVFTEFTNCDGICSVGQSRVIHRLQYNPRTERPIVAQIWGKTPDNYQQTAKLCLELGFDGVDINMGCPEKNVIKQGCCSALIINQDLAKDIIQATKQGVNGQIPVSVKTRIGFKDIDTNNWIGFLLDQGLSAITVHGRTVAGSDQPAIWSEIAKSVVIRDTKHNQKLDDIKSNWISLLIG